MVSWPAQKQKADLIESIAQDATDSFVIFCIYIYRIYIYIDIYVCVYNEDGRH